VEVKLLFQSFKHKNVQALVAKLHSRIFKVVETDDKCCHTIWLAIVGSSECEFVGIHLSVVNNEPHILISQLKLVQVLLCSNADYRDRL
jgi:uncharacterized protein YegJ (DUF2314 family)